MPINWILGHKPQHTCMALTLELETLFIEALNTS